MARFVNDPTGQRPQQFDIGNVVRRFRYRFGRAWWDLSPEQKQAIEDISECMTKKRGGRLIGCCDCDNQHWTYNGCKKRSCPKCSGAETREWLVEMEREILPCPHFHLTVSIPTGLHVHFYQEDQRYLYGLFMAVVREQLHEIAGNPKYLGADVSMFQLLHTWNGCMEYHPHVHIMVSAGGMKNGQWIKSNPAHLVPNDLLGNAVREEFQQRLRRMRPEIYARIKPLAWQQKWKVHSQRYEIKDRRILLQYLSRFVYRVAIAHNQLLVMDENTVTYRYKDRQTDEYRYETLDGGEFLKRFVRHVLPKDFHKARKSGLYHYRQNHEYKSAVVLLQQIYHEELTKLAFESRTDTDGTNEIRSRLKQSRHSCPYCGSKRLYCIREVMYGELIHNDPQPYQNRHGP